MKITTKAKLSRALKRAEALSEQIREVRAWVTRLESAHDQLVSDAREALDAMRGEPEECDAKPHHPSVAHYLSEGDLCFSCGASYVGGEWKVLELPDA